MSSGLYPDFLHGANTMVKPMTLNFDAPVKSPVKPDEFSGVVLDKNIYDDNLANSEESTTKAFNSPNAKEVIPAKASLSGMV